MKYPTSYSTYVLTPMPEFIVPETKKQGISWRNKINLKTCPKFYLKTSLKV